MRFYFALVVSCIFFQQNGGVNAQSHSYGGGLKTRVSGNPTIVSQHYNPNYNARVETFGSNNQAYNTRAIDARTLKTALDAPEPDTKALITILAHKSNLERLDIAAYYENLYHQPLAHHIEAKLSGSFKDLLLALLLPPTEFYVKELHDAINGVGTDEDALIDILCTTNNQGLRTIKKVYELTYKKSLEDDIKEDTSGDFQNLMLTLAAGERDETQYIDKIQAKKDAQRLFEAGKQQWGTDEPVFISILSQSNFKQIQQIAQEYELIAGHSLESAIQDEFSGTIRSGLLAILHASRSIPEFYAERLHASMAGSGTNNKQLIRIVTSRSEVDMDLIKLFYKNNYKTTLEDDIIDDTSGEYKDCLLNLVGGSIFQQTVKF